jgi:hypothetical protein
MHAYINSMHTHTTTGERGSAVLESGKKLQITYVSDDVTQADLGTEDVEDALNGAGIWSCNYIALAATDSKVFVQTPAVLAYADVAAALAPLLGDSCTVTSFKFTDQKIGRLPGVVSRGRFVRKEEQQQLQQQQQQA